MTTERPKVLFVSYTAEWTGPTKSLSYLLQYLRKPYHIGVAYPAHGPLEEVLHEFGVQEHSRRALDKWEIPSLAALIRDEGYDLVYANNTSSSSRNAFLASVLARRPFVCHVRGMGWDKGWVRLGYLRFSAGVVSVSRACAASVERFVKADRLHVVHNGIPFEATEGDREDSPSVLRAELGVDEDELLVVSVSHVCARKGQLQAVEALRRLHDSVPEAHLCLVGSLEREPGYVRKVRDRAAELGIADRLHLVGFRRDIPAVLEDADLFLHTAMEDPHPRAVIEAMAAGVPVVAYAVDGVAETVIEGQTGRLVDRGDVEQLAAGLAALAANPDLRRAWGEAGRERARSKFTARSTAEQIAGVIDGALEEAR